MEEKKTNITKVTIEPGCIACGTCQVICPEVFQVTDISEIKPDVDLNIHADRIQEAVDLCPVGVISLEKK